jgi:hypothetical protein
VLRIVDAGFEEVIVTGRFEFVIKPASDLTNQYIVITDDFLNDFSHIAVEFSLKKIINS